MFQLPRECRLFAKMQPATQWGWQEILLNKLVYLAELQVWFKTKDGQKKTPKNRPKPFVPDFMAGVSDTDNAAKDIEVHTTDDIQNILNMPRV